MTFREHPRYKALANAATQSFVLHRYDPDEYLAFTVGRSSLAVLRNSLPGPSMVDMYRASFIPAPTKGLKSCVCLCCLHYDGVASIAIALPRYIVPLCGACAGRYKERAAVVGRICLILAGRMTRDVARIIAERLLHLPQ
jgi:hypothetical protein